MPYSPFEDSQSEHDSVAGDKVTGPHPTMSCGMCPVDMSFCGGGRGYKKCVEALNELEKGD